MTFQKFVFTVFDVADETSCGIYATFKEAYERIERRHKNALAIIDNGDEQCGCSFFDVIHRYSCTYVNHRYVIIRNLLTVFPNDQTISYEMVKELEKRNEECQKNNYKTLNDFM